MLSDDLGGDPSALSSDESADSDPFAGLRQQMNSANVLVYLLDLEAFLGTSDSRVQNEHCWLLKTFLTNPAWENKHRLVLLTKKDKYEGLIAGAENDVRKCIQEHLPKLYSIGKCLGPNPRVEYAAVSSVATRTCIGADEVPLRVPIRPFRAGDMSAVVGFLRRLSLDARSEETLTTSTTTAKPPDAAGCMVLLLLPLMTIMFWWLWIRPVLLTP
jgi:hypothetical protein